MAEDYGVRISKPGYNAIDAGDIDLVFSSSWPALPIAQEISTSVYDGVIPSTATSHTVGFPPMTVGWTRISGVTHTVFPNVNSTNILPSTSYPNPQTYGYTNFKCFNIDLTKDIEYPVVRTPAAQVGSYDPDYGIRIAKEGSDINSTDMRDFILHSRCQSPQILAVKIGNNVGGGTLTYTSPLGYTSWVFGYVKIASLGYYVYAPYFAQAYPVTSINNVNQSYSITYVAGDIAVLVVLRDPMFAATKTAVVY